MTRDPATLEAPKVLLQEAGSAPRVMVRQTVPIKKRGESRPTTCGVVVHNPRTQPIHDVRVEQDVPLGLRYLGANPAPRRKGRRLIWDLGPLNPDQARTLRVKVAPTRGVPLPEQERTTFEISWVQETGLFLNLVGPAQMRLGQEALLRLRVVNASDQAAENVALRCLLSSTLAGTRTEQIESQLGTVGPHQARMVSLNIQARKLGILQCQATVEAPGWAEAAARLDVRVDFGAALNAAGTAAATLAPQIEAPAGEQYLVFSLAGGEFAVPLGLVREVDRPPPVTPVPNVPAWLLGVAHVRGDIVSVVDLRSLLGLPANGRGERGRMVVVRSSDGTLTTGLVVDRVGGLRLLEGRPGGGGPVAALAPFVRGVAERDGTSVAVLDLDRFLQTGLPCRFEGP